MTDRLRIFIWEGNGISDAYHDDGTLVVLAHTPEEARQIIRQDMAEQEKNRRTWNAKRDRAMEKFEGPVFEFWKTEKGKALLRKAPLFNTSYFDGSDAALDRKPDRVVELDGPKWVAFNGGGYD